ncbi:MAG: hypothetical protein F6K41_29860 [Symploca sp. SIO3E6]|nr:hypothetical protein [Caldora sp. SIO3E6]
MLERNDETIWIVTADTALVSENDGAKTGDSSRSSPYSKSPVPTNRAARGARLSVRKLEAEMSKFLQIVGGLFNRAQKQVNQQSGLKLDEIELSVEISGEGEVKLLGTGGKAGTKGAITLKFKRVES